MNKQDLTVASESKKLFLKENDSLVFKRPNLQVLHTKQQQWTIVCLLKTLDCKRHTVQY